MVAASDYAFRCLCRQYNPTTTILTYTQMIHAHKIIQEPHFCRNHFDFYEYNDNDDSSLVLLPSQRAILGTKTTSQQQQYTVDNDEWIRRNLSIHRSGPLIVQLAGNNPDIVTEAAQKILHHTNGRIHGFDLNCGCPQDIARKGNYGAHLMESDEQAVYKVLEKLRASLPETVSVSAKIRLPMQPDKLKDCITNLIDTGINYVTIHGRTIKENKTAVRQCHFDAITDAIQIANSYHPTGHFPIMANGGVETFNDIATIRQITGAVAVMSSEALLENPAVLTRIIMSEEIVRHQFQVAYDYINWCTLFPPIPGVLGLSMNIVRGHLFKFLFRSLSYFPELRDELANSNKIRTLQQAQHFIERLEEQCRMLVQSMNQEQYETFVHLNSSWYRRHWDARTSERSSTKSNEYSSYYDMAASSPDTSTSITPTTPESIVSIEERKLLVKSRIEQLRKQRIAKEALQ